MTASLKSTFDDDSTVVPIRRLDVSPPEPTPRRTRNRWLSQSRIVEAAAVLLTRAGYDAFSMRSLAEVLGVEAAARGGFDLILMDVQMPGIDGMEAARRIRALGGPAADTPIVALTANVLAHQRRAYLDAGMDGVVGKPVSPGSLLREIARLSAAAADDDAREGAAA